MATDMIRIALISLALATPAAAFDGQFDLRPDGGGLVLGSWHPDPTGDVEGFNPGAYLTFEGDLIDVDLALFRNSFGDPAVSVTGSSEFVSLRAGDFSATPFFGTAYYGERGETFTDGSDNPYNINGWIPFGGVRFKHDDVPLGLSAMPCPPKECRFVVAFTWELF